MDSFFSQRRRIIACIDIEAISFTRVVAIGVVVGDGEGNILEKQEWWITFIKSDIAPATQDFWDKNPELIPIMEKEGKDEETQIKSFVQFWDGIAKKYGIAEKDIELVADNPEFDFARLTPYVEKYCKRDPIRYTTTKEYRPITDYLDAIWKMGLGHIIEKRANDVQVHDHRPSNDAEHNYVSHLCAETNCIH